MNARPYLSTVGGLCLLASNALATDHNNIEKDRPLRCDDAYSIASGAVEWQNGFRLDTFSRLRPTYTFRSEIPRGFATNKDLSIGFEPLFFSLPQ